MEYSIQLYSVRDITQTDMEAALKAMSEIGYKKVEFAGFGNKTAAECAELLKKYGLKVSACHLSLKRVDEEHIEETVRNMKAVGTENPVVPSIALATKNDLDRSIEILNFAQKRFAQEGMTLHFHNHAAEFFPNEDGQVPFDELYHRTNLFFEIDTYWAYAGKRDPVALIEKLHKDKRLSLIHLKDGTGEAEDSAGRPLGMGNAPVAAIRSKAAELGADIIVESETLTPSGIEEARICFEYLMSLEK